MSNIIIQKIISEFEQDFDTFENYLLLSTEINEFKDYLLNYRGMPVKLNESSFQLSQFAKQFTENIISYFVNIFSKSGLFSCQNHEITNILCEVEKSVNLILYYWFGLKDRNYQFMTLIHFYNINNVSSVFLTKNNQDFSVTLTEYGIKFGSADSLHEPKCMPVSKVCALTNFYTPNDERVLFARIRTVQREICLLIDDWEHLNSVLAVDYGTKYHNLQQNYSKKSEEEFEAVSQKMNIRRDTLALWCMESFCEFQDWITFLKSKNNFNEDILSEIDAAAALLLSAVQKIFLPASVSRHRYCSEILPLFKKFAMSRIAMNSDDLSSHLLLQVIQSSEGKSFSNLLLSFIEKKPFEWSLTFDPSSALKAFSWSYSREHHILLCLIYTISYFRKIVPNFVNNHQLSDIATTIQMPETFAIDPQHKILNFEKSDISSELFEKLYLIAKGYLEKNFKVTKNNEELYMFVLNGLKL